MGGLSTVGVMEPGAKLLEGATMVGGFLYRPSVEATKYIRASSIDYPIVHRSRRGTGPQ